MYANRRNFRVLKEIGVEEHDGDVRFWTGSGNIALSFMRHASGYNYRNSSFIVDVAIGQIPRSTERISSLYSNQYSHVRWGNSVSSTFPFSNGVRQGGVLSPYLFTRYIRDMIRIVTRSNIGCIIDGQIINLLAYADDFVVIAPSWRVLQRLLSIIHSEVMTLDMTCNTKKTDAWSSGLLEKKELSHLSFPYLK